MPTSTISLRGYLSGFPSGSRTIAPTDIYSGSSPMSETQIVLASGDNTITVPSGAIGAIIFFAVGSTVTKKLKGAGGDTGITLAAALWNVITLAGVSSFIINASAADTGKTTEILFF